MSPPYPALFAGNYKYGGCGHLFSGTLNKVACSDSTGKHFTLTVSLTRIGEVGLCRQGNGSAVLQSEDAAVHSGSNAPPKSTRIFPEPAGALFS